MAKKKEVSVEERLRALYDLQLIDSRVDEIRNVRGELPLEVRDLEDEVEGLSTRLQKLLIEKSKKLQFWEAVEALPLSMRLSRMLMSLLLPT